MTLTSPGQLYELIDMMIAFLKSFYIVGNLSLYSAITTLLWFSVAGVILNWVFGGSRDSK